MPQRGDFYANEVTGERAVVLRGDEDGAGQSFLVHLSVTPHGAVAMEHVHPSITERFSVMSGTLGVKLDGEEFTLGAGEKAEVPPGTPHDWWNVGEDTAEVIVEVDPAEIRFAHMIGTIFGVGNAGKTNDKGMPNPLQMALIAMEYDDVIQITKPPRPVQRLVFPALGAIGRLRGYSGSYPEYFEPHGHEEPDPAALAAAGLSPSRR